MLCLLLAVFAFSSVIIDNGANAATCKNTPHYYNEFGCKVVKTSEDGCPLRYDCPQRNYSEAEVCYYHGKEYAEGDKLPEPENGGPICSAGCFCSKDETLQFTCAHISCPNVFQAPGLDCIKQFSPKSCCSTNEVCGTEAIEKLPTCYLEGKEYRQHEKMYHSNELCYTCYCEEGFDNSTIVDNKNCHKAQCDSEVHYTAQLKQGCIPIYYGNVDCCPIAWKCPSEKDTVIESTAGVTPVDPDNQCTFGKLQVPIGDKVSVEASGIECICEIPPIPTCIQAAT